MRFQDIPGNTATKEKLCQSVTSGKVAHAQLFLGKEGALNLPLAIAFATYLHCQNRTAGDACGTCPACSKNLKYIHPDTNFVFPLGNIKGDKDEEKFKAEIMKTWRSFLLEQPFGNHDNWAGYYGGEDKMAIISREDSRDIIRTLSLKSFESPFKVMIIWQPEYMHPSAANGLLKILEEPPANTFFLLVSNAAERLLPTIVSRLQTVQVPLLSDEELEGWLKTQGHDPAKIHTAVQLADGNLNTAVEIIAAEEDHHQDKFATWMRACYKKEYGALVALADEFHADDRMMQRTFLQYSLDMLRETLLNISGASAINRTKGGELKFIQDFSKVMTTDRIERSTQLINESSMFLERNGSAKMIFLDMSLRISSMF